MIMMAMAWPLSALAQQFEVTPDGLRDKGNLQNTYLVIETPGKTAAELYQNAIRYVQKQYKNPDAATKGSIENELLRFDTYAPQFAKVNNSGAMLVTSMEYGTELQFKDDKVRIEISNVDITADNGGRSVFFSGSIWSGYPIYNEKNGKLKQAEFKAELETYFNNHISEITAFLLGKTTNDNW